MQAAHGAKGINNGLGRGMQAPKTRQNLKAASLPFVAALPPELQQRFRSFPPGGLAPAPHPDPLQLLA